MICKHKSIKLNSVKFTKNSIKHLTFVYTQLNELTVLFQTIQFSISENGSKYCDVSLTNQLNISHLFTHS